MRSGAAFLLVVLFARTAAAEPIDEAHFRGGANAFVGAGLGAGLTGTVVGGAGRAGWAITRRFAFYEQLELYSWNGEIVTAYGAANGGFGARLIALGSYSPFAWLELAVGPSIDLAFAATSSTTTGNTVVPGVRSVPIVFDGGFIGFREHLGILVPLTRAPRTGPSLGLDLHSFVIAQERLPSTLTVGLGYDWF